MYSVFGALLLLGAAFADSEDDLYVPFSVECSSNSTLTRKANSLSESEESWIKGRDAVTNPALIDWLSNSNLTDFDASSFLSNTTIRVATAFSGGGYRAMLCGAGQVAALDNRTNNSTESGHMGGFLQASSYISGLSGGNWLLGSMVVNNWTSVQDLQSSQDLWDLSHNILNPGGINVFKTGSYWDDISDSVSAKKDAGYNTSITDIWGRALSYQFFQGTRGGVQTHYSNVRDFDEFTSYSMPFPIHVADGRAPGTTVISTNSSVFEINPFELGSWDPSVYSFVDLRYVGTPLQNGESNGTCINGYDNVGFVIGTSSSLFNALILNLNSSGLTGVLYTLAESILTDLGEDNDDIAIWEPNPFYGLDYIDNNLTESYTLDLVDGGEDLQNVPLHPLIQPERNIDFLFAFDNSADTYDDNPNGANFPDGASLIATFERQFAAQGNNTIFPYVPDNKTFIYGGLTLQPTFFGCSRDNLTSLFDDSLAEEDRYYPPVVAYMANSYHSYASNTSTFKMSYDTDEVAGMIQNGYEVTTQNNGTTDSEWRSCVACAVILREQQRRGISPSDQCQKCFDKYCWNGTIVDTPTSDTASRPDGSNNTSSETNSKKNGGTSFGVSVAALSIACIALIM